MSRAPFHPSSVLSLRSRFTHLPTVGGRRTRKRSDRGEGRLDREVREAGERRNRGNPLAILLLPVHLSSFLSLHTPLVVSFHSPPEAEERVEEE